MFTSMSKIRKAKGGQPDELEESVAQVNYQSLSNMEGFPGFPGYPLPIRPPPLSPSLLAGPP